MCIRATRAPSATDVTRRVPANGLFGFGVHRRVGNRTGHLLGGQPPTRRVSLTGFWGRPRFGGVAARAASSRSLHLKRRVGLDLVFAVTGISASRFVGPSGMVKGLLMKLLVEKPCHGPLLAREDNGLEIALRILEVPYPGVPSSLGARAISLRSSSRGFSVPSLAHS